MEQTNSTVEITIPPKTSTFKEWASDQIVTQWLLKI